MKFKASWRDFSWLLNACQNATNLLYRTGCTWPVNGRPWNWRKLKSAECWRDNSSPTLRQTESRLVVKGFLVVRCCEREKLVLYVMAILWMSTRSGQSELKRCIHLTEGIANFVTWMVANCWINWHLTVAKCAVPSGLSHRLCCNKRAVQICVAGCFNCTKGDPSLVAVTLH